MYEQGWSKDDCGLACTSSSKHHTYYFSLDSPAIALALSLN